MEVAAGVMLKYEGGKVAIEGLAGGEDIGDIAANLDRLAKAKKFETMPEGIPWGLINLAGYSVRSSKVPCTTSLI
jgi:hypothetical protein